MNVRDGCLSRTVICYHWPNRDLSRSDYVSLTLTAFTITEANRNLERISSSLRRNHSAYAGYCGASAGRRRDRGWGTQYREVDTVRQLAAAAECD